MKHQTPNQTCSRTQYVVEPETESESETDKGSEVAYKTPCREASRYMVACPLCGRRVQVKTLRFSHRCGRNFDPAVRAREQAAAAAEAVKRRMAPTETGKKRGRR